MKQGFDITMVGEVNLDMVLYGLPAEMPLERELLASGFSMTLGSSSAILAHNMATLGVSVGFQGQVGDDMMGRTALERLRTSGVNTERIATVNDGVGTGVTLLLPHDGKRHILTYMGTMATLTARDVDVPALCTGRHFHLSSLFLQQGLRPDVAELLQKVRAAGLTISLDTNDDPEDRWEGIAELLPLVDILMPNEAEACRMAGCVELEEAVDRLAAVVPLVVVKCGQSGALVAQRGERTRVPGIKVTPKDTIGAGDSFNAGFLTAYLRGQGAAACAAAGNVCGALSTLRSGGTEAFTDAALRTSFLQQHGHGWLQQAVERAS